MKAIGINHSYPITHAESLIEFDLPTPDYGDNDLLIDVQAISVNPVDYKVRASSLPNGGPARILGWDGLGIVKAMGKNVTQFKLGDKVYYAGAINRQGSYAQLQAVDARIAAHVPQTINDEDAVALPLTALTAWEALFDRLRITQAVPGAANAIVIIGGAGGVASIAIQLVKALTNLNVIATASRPESISWVKKMGADYVINHREPLAPQIEALGLGQPGFVFSTANTDLYLPDIIRFIAPQGHIALIDDPKSLDIISVKSKSLSVHLEMMFTRSLFNTADIDQQRQILTTIATLIDQHKIVSTRTETIGTINVDHLKKAHAMLESGTTIGKLVLANW